MRVAIDVLSARSGGARKYLGAVVPRLCEESERSGSGPIIVVGGDRLCCPDAKGRGRIRRLCRRADAMSPASRIAVETIGLRRALGRLGVEVLFVPYQVPYIRGPFRIVLALRNMEPFLFRRYRYEVRNWLRNAILRQLTVMSARRADRVIAVSECVRRYLSGSIGVPDDRIVVVHHGCDDAIEVGEGSEDSTILANLGVREPYLLTVGSLRPYRRCEDVIKAAVDAGIDGRIVVAGAFEDSRYRRTVLRAVERAGGSARVTVIGHVRSDHMPALYRRARVFVTASEIEAWPNAALEALRWGCPSIFVDNDVLNEVFGSAAVRIPERDVRAMSSAIADLWTDCSAQERLRCQGTERAQAFRWRDCAQKTWRALTEW